VTGSLSRTAEYQSLAITLEGSQDSSVTVVASSCLLLYPACHGRTVHGILRNAITMLALLFFSHHSHTHSEFDSAKQYLSLSLANSTTGVSYPARTLPLHHGVAYLYQVSLSSRMDMACRNHKLTSERACVLYQSIPSRMDVCASGELRWPSACMPSC
jgi:hypothetical protein